MMPSLATALPDEINRVRQLQDEYKSLRAMPNVMVEPQILMMEAAITRAISASASGDVIAMLRSFEELKGYEG
jgi:hypothetical protein